MSKVISGKGKISFYKEKDKETMEKKYPDVQFEKMNQLKEDIINWKKHVVWVESYEIPNIVNKVLGFHNALTKEEFIELQESNRILWQQYLSFSGFYKKLINHVKNII